MANSSLARMLLHVCAYFGLGGFLLQILAVILPAPIYRGTCGERYSPLNHFISELGEAGVSRGARIFNLSLFAAGCFFIPFVIGLGLSIGNLWAKIGLLAGVAAAISCSLIGVFSMNQLEKHIIVANVFFRTGLIAILLFASGIWFQSAKGMVLPKAAAFVSIPAILAYTLFIFVGMRPKQGAQPADSWLEIIQQRPRIWTVVVLEWLVFIATMGWFLGLSLVILLG
jgi:hypothetical protein